MRTANVPMFYRACPRCRTPERQPCVAISGNRFREAGLPLRRVHPGRARTADAPKLQSGRNRDEEVVERRLIVWKRRAQLGDPVEDIAAELGMTRIALDRFVIRARKRGHPKAVYHAKARRLPHSDQDATASDRT